MPTGLKTPTEADKVLQEQLHDLITKLTQTMDHVKSWPEDQGNASVHMEQTRKLIEKINLILSTVKKVEGTVRKFPALQKSLQDCMIPTDLLDLMDHGGGLHPDCFVRGLFQEALGQLAGLKRRKLALKMLGNALQMGIQRKQQQQQNSSLKRQRSQDEDDPHTSSDQPHTKKTKITES